MDGDGRVDSVCQPRDGFLLVPVADYMLFQTHSCSAPIAERLATPII